MSETPGKRLHEEGGGGCGSDGTGHYSPSKHPRYDLVQFPSNVGPKMTRSSVVNDYHTTTSFDMGQEAQVLKIPRADCRDVDGRSPLLSMYRESSSPKVLQPDHSIALENRLEVRDSKATSRDLRVEHCDTKVESRELYLGAKGDKDVRVESSGDDNKEDAIPDLEYKGDPKMENDVYGAVSSHLKWKYSKEQKMGKRNPDARVEMVDPWHTSCSNLSSLVEVEKDGLTTEVKDYVAAHEAVGENKVDLKAVDKLKGKDRKRKEGKHREWAERDRTNNLQVGNGSGEGKESIKDGGEAVRLERDRKDRLKDKEKPKEREKDHAKKEGWNKVEKDGSHNEKEPVDVSGSTPGQENAMLEQKKQKDHDSWKTVNKGARERRKERNANVEGERPENRGRCHEKESNDGCVDAEGGMESEKDVSNYGVPQNKRMLLPKGSPQKENLEPRFISCTQDNEGSQGKFEESTAVYRVGKCMQGLIKLWKEYESSQADKNGQSSQNGPTLEILIPAEHVTATNRQVRSGQLWGTDTYTDDSDLVAVLMHTGFYHPSASPPPPAIQELRATIRVLPPQDCYISTIRNNVRSRAWGAAVGCSYRVERCCIVKKGGETRDLEPCLINTSSIKPTLAPAAVEPKIITRAAALNALRKQRFVREVTVQYNLCNEPWIKYNINIVADKGLKMPLYTSARLKKGEVLYLETYSRRYELCFTGDKMVKASTVSQAHETVTEKSPTHNLLSRNGEKSALDCESIMIDLFRWSRCKKPLPREVMYAIGVPLPLEHLEVLEENVGWEDILWSQTGVCIAGKEYPVTRVHFFSPN
ncbi:uncharacterized protein LOC132286526 [Cornus florida]|uniref:uncharacterized protein LOC132286526 n=1 Tax=Cornus florida TaxID=4283 RepID=UPI0028A141AB|nr:uncharacterized protein LOC132286526 [Cornus florida]